MIEIVNDLAKRYEVRHCGRCGGSGRYSFNLMDGDRCYGCGGSGIVRTARGEAARRFFTDSLAVDTGVVRVGWVAQGTSGKWFPVTNVAPYRLKGSSTTNGITVEYDKPGVCITYGGIGHILDLESQIAAKPSMEEVKVLKAAALAYQQTLNEKGKPGKDVAA